MGTPTEITIRQMTFADIESVYKMETESFPYAMWSPEFFQNCLKSNRHVKLVAELDKKILAYAILEFLGENVYLLKFVVDSNFRRRSLGKSFLEWLINLTRQRGGAFMKLHVNTKNVAAIRLYESCGFKVCERLENFYKSNNENAFTMERKL